jgi:AraC-like DNA-binding protein
MLAYMTARSLDGLLELVKELGGSDTRLIEATGISRALFSDADGLIPYALHCQLLENAAVEVGRRDFALLLARHRVASNYAKELQIYTYSSKNLRQAIEGLMDHLRTRTLGIDYALEVQRDTACFSRTPPSSEAARYPQASILLLGSLYLMLLKASGGRFELTSVSLTFRDPGIRAELKAFFRCPLYFDAEINSLNFPARLLELGIATQDDGLHDLMVDYLASRQLQETRDFTELVRHLISRNLAAGRPDIDALSLRIPFQSRTIQKKLKESGTSFTALLNEVRFELAESLLLQSDIPITYIAQRLCFQDISAFSKAFSKHYGMSPRQWKKQLLEEPAGAAPPQRASAEP